MEHDVETNWFEEVKPPVVPMVLGLPLHRGTRTRCGTFADGQHSLCLLAETVFGSSHALVMMGNHHAPMQLDRAMVAGLLPYLHCFLVYGHVADTQVDRFRPLRLLLGDEVVTPTKAPERLVRVRSHPPGYESQPVEEVPGAASPLTLEQRCQRWLKQHMEAWHGPRAEWTPELRREYKESLALIWLFARDVVAGGPTVEGGTEGV